MHPLQEIRAFVSGLPDTIRSLVHAQIGLAFLELDFSPEVSATKEGAAYLDRLCESPRGSGSVVNAVLIAGLFDYIFSRWTVGISRDGKWLEEIAREHEDSDLMAMALQEPLKHRHMLQTYERWCALRETALSIPALIVAEREESSKIFDNLPRLPSFDPR